MDIEKHISNLLYRYDCVIIPEFGGFLTQKTSARYNSVSHEFFPPTKELRFNSSLKNHDGLLINYISQVENKTFDDVFNIIQTQVKKWKSELIEDKELTLKNIGTFVLNKEGNLLFSPFEKINYAKDSFGLTPVKIHYILTEEKQRTTSKKVSKIVAGFALLALVGALGYTQKDNVKYQMANVFSPTTVLEDSRDLSSFISHAPALYPQPFVMKPITNEDLEKNTDERNPETIKGEYEEKVYVKQIGKYQLISGAFKNANNAKKKWRQLKAEGFQNAQILGVLSGMTIVSYDTYHNQEKARKEANNLKSQGKEVWLRVKK
ncbi:MAG: SPOR domain-containing protein [Flavobacteriales bacterium]